MPQPTSRIRLLLVSKLRTWCARTKLDGQTTPKIGHEAEEIPKFCAVFLGSLNCCLSRKVHRCISLFPMTIVW